MICITVMLQGGEYVSVESVGHAGYAEEGLDIICSAVSVLLLNTANSIEALTEDRIVSEAGEGYVYFTLPDGCSRETKLLIQSLLLGLRDIRRSYGEQYLNIAFKEVQDHVKYEPSDFRS